jgi:hypothetical protein
MEATMLNPVSVLVGSAGARSAAPVPAALRATSTGTPASGLERNASYPDLDDNDTSPIEWSEEDVVLLHWRLLQEVSHLADPDTPLEEKFDTLRWVFTERSKDLQPFSFVNCLRVVGCSPLSPIAFCGLVDAHEIRDHIRNSLRAWFDETLKRYPEWVREAIVSNPAWVEARLARNPQWINEQLKQMAAHGDLFA